MTNPQALHFRGARITSGMPRQPIDLPERPGWFTDARRACNPAYGQDHLFTSDELPDRNQAARRCRERCPFVAECLAWAIANDERHHVWGGKNFTPQTVHNKPLSRTAVPA